jgi:hypothetical protein
VNTLHACALLGLGYLVDLQGLVVAAALASPEAILAHVILAVAIRGCILAEGC